MALPLMPKATAVWLIDNTMLSFRQIADFCGLHPLAIQGMADGEVDQNIVGLDPVANSQLTRAEIERCEKDANANLVLRESAIPIQRQKKGARYTPVSKRQDRPAAIAWILRHHPELTDAQIRRLLGTTKDTINKIRERTHWNINNLEPIDPVALGLCKQSELDAAVQKAAAKAARTEADKKAKRLQKKAEEKEEQAPQEDKEQAKEEQKICIRRFQTQ